MPPKKPSLPIRPPLKKRPLITTTKTTDAPTPKTTTTPRTTDVTAPKTSITPKTTNETTSVPPTTTTTPKTTDATTTPKTTNETTSVATTTTTPQTIDKPTPKTTGKTIVRKIIVKKIVKAKRPVQNPHQKQEEAQTLTKEEPSVPEETPVQNPSPPTAVANEAQTDGNGDSGKEPEPVGEANADQESGKGEEAVAGDVEIAVSERRRKRKAEIFLGGLDKDAKEEDIRKVFEKIGEIVEVRLMMNNQTGKNKGYAFLRFASPADAKRAVEEFPKVEVCGKRCATAALEDHDTIYIGNIDKTWKKEDITKILHEIGIENIDTVTVMIDPKIPDTNRGFAFLELETNRDAQIAFKKLQKKGVFGKDRNIKISWAEPLNEPDEEEMLKVKSVYADGVPSSWTEDKVRKYFTKYGDIERVVLARNMQSAKRKDFAFIHYTTREAALSCIEEFSKEELTDKGSKVNVKVSLANPVQKGKQSKTASKPRDKDYPNERPKGINKRDGYDTNRYVSSDKQKFVSDGVSRNVGGNKKSSTTHELLKVIREQAAWGPGQSGSDRGITVQDYARSLPGGKRPYTASGDDVYSDRAYPRPRLDSYYPVGSSSYSSLSHGVSGSPLHYYHQSDVDYTAGSRYRSEAGDPLSRHQMRHRLDGPYGSGSYSRY